VFLSTDAGGVGLNLQNASTVVNMDLPWNPAVLDQRVGRVHRLGQHRPVRVVNFVAQGTIEHGMLSVLSFKQSMFAGVLDGGAQEVFLGGTRLKRFMDSVDNVTQAIPPSMPQQEERREDRPEQPEPAAPATAHGPDWQALLTTGVALLNKLAGSLSSETKAPVEIGAGLKVEREEATGQRRLILPVPSKAVLRDIASLLSHLADKL
jgi:superfamily II DNA/RNA helicase